MGLRRKALGVVILVLFLGGFLLFRPVQTYAYQQSDRKAASVSGQISETNNEFGLDLLKQVSSEQDGNVVISPISVSSSLAMAYTGSAGATREQISRTIALGNRSDSDVGEDYRLLMQSLENVDSRVKVSVANSAWIKEDFPVREGYVSDLETYYDAKIGEGIDKQEMNSWVARQTEGKIDEIVKNVRSRDRMFLINAVYFDGKWREKFDESSTSSEEFEAPGGNVTVEMMSQKEEFGYYGSDRYSLARLPYGRDKVAMYVLLPERNAGVDKVLENLTANELDQAFNATDKRELRVKLPKFKAEYSRRLNSDLKSLGMENAFNRSSANFSGISRRPLYISTVRHKTFIEVDEKGTEAAAATSVGATFTSATLPTSFEVDRPFIFFIRDDRSGAVLFSGKITNPNG
jgi:serpin B